MSHYFFRETGSDGFMSNFFPTTFEKDGNTFTSSEQAFMYDKCRRFDPDNARMLRLILSEHNPKKVKALGRKVRNYDETIWCAVRFDTMVDILRCKFAYNAEIRAALLQTGSKVLYEASPYDRIWGIGYGKREAQHIDPERFGENLLGKALMKVRSELNIQAVVRAYEFQGWNDKLHK